MKRITEISLALLILVTGLLGVLIYDQLTPDVPTQPMPIEITEPVFRQLVYMSFEGMPYDQVVAACWLVAEQPELAATTFLEGMEEAAAWVQLTDQQVAEVLVDACEEQVGI